MAGQYFLFHHDSSIVHGQDKAEARGLRRATANSGESLLSINGASDVGTRYSPASKL